VAIVRRDHDVPREHHLDTDGINHPLHRRDDGLAAAIGEREGIYIARRPFLHGGGWPEEFGHIQPGGEMLALCAEHANAEIGGAVKQRQRVRKLLHHVGMEGIHLRRIIDDDLEHMPVRFGADASDLAFTHHASPGLIWSFARRAVKWLYEIQDDNDHVQCQAQTIGSKRWGIARPTRRKAASASWPPPPSASVKPGWTASAWVRL
jgi:hypothetical protein